MLKRTLRASQSLRVKVIIFIGLIMFATIGVSSFLYINSFRTNYLEAIEWRSVSLVQSLYVDIQSRYQYFGNLADQQLLLQSTYFQCKRLYEANRDRYVAFVAILDENGLIISHNDKNRWGSRLNDPALLSALQSGQIKTVLVGPNYHTLIPITTENGRFLAAIDVGLPQSIVTDKIEDSMRSAILICLALFLVVFLLVWLFIKQALYRPIAHLIEVTTDIANGNLTREIAVEKVKEFRELACSLTHMRDSIRRNINEIEQKTQQVKALIACSPVALFSVDVHGAVAIWTESAERLFGWQADEVTGQPLPIIPDSAQERFNEIFARVCQGEVMLGQEFQQKRKNDTLFHASLSSSPIRDSSGAIVGIMASVEDISTRIAQEKAHQEMQEQLLQSQKMESVGRLAGGVAHDYNNMLGVILGSAELALMNMDESDANRRYLKEIINAAQRSADITRQLLAFARKQTIAPVPLDLNDCISDMLKILRRLIGENIELEWLPQSSLGMVKMDATQIDQILANICINAKDAMPTGGKITLQTRSVKIDQEYCDRHHGFQAGEFICLSISDNGLGMDRETREKIFEPFFSTKKVNEGTGLGLATVYGIIKQNNGFINIYSEQGIGSTFNIYFPEHHGVARKKEVPPPAATPSGHGELVLLVEDEKAILQMCQKILVSLGYQVICSETANQALELVRSARLDIRLLITDVILPDLNGRELSQQLKQNYPELKVLFMSGYTANVIAHSGVLDEGVNFIQKPFSKNELAAKVAVTLTTAA